MTGRVSLIVHTKNCLPISLDTYLCICTPLCICAYLCELGLVNTTTNAHFEPAISDNTTVHKNVKNWYFFSHIQTHGIISLNTTECTLASPTWLHTHRIIRIKLTEHGNKLVHVIVRVSTARNGTGVRQTHAQSSQPFVHRFFLSIYLPTSNYLHIHTSIHAYISTYICSYVSFQKKKYLPTYLPANVRTACSLYHKYNQI